MIRLPGKVSRDMIVLVFFKCGIAQVTPKNCCHSQLMCHFKRLAYFLQLPRRFLASKVNCCTDRCCSKIPTCFDRSKHDLVKLVRICQELVVINLYNKWNFVCIFSSEQAKASECCSHCIAFTFDSELNYIFRIKIDWIFCKRCTSAVLDALVNRQYR